MFDHHYVFPRGRSGILEAELQAARELGLRFVASRGSMDLGASHGGLPPDSLVETLDEILSRHRARRRAGRRRPAADRRRALLAVLGHASSSWWSRPRSRGASACGCTRTSRRRPTRTSSAASATAARPSSTSIDVGWLGDDVWCAHCVHVARRATCAHFATHGVGVAHCPASNLRLGAGVAPVREMLDAGVHVGLGVDGSASNERGDLMFEVKQALLVARGRGGPRAMTAREALRLGTRGGAAVLGRDDIGSLEPGKRADIAVWRTDGLELAGAAATPSPGSCCRARTASTGSTSAASRSCATGISCEPTRTRSPASSARRRRASSETPATLET